MNWERARKPEQKAVRREAILRAARTLFSEWNYEEISLNAIAREAGFSKPNLYRYFSTREEIFLAIFAEEQTKFVRTLVSRLKRVRARDRVKAISQAWLDVAVEHPAFLDLLPQLSTSMEKNSSVEQLVEFKKISFESLDELIVALEQTYPHLNRKQWVKVAQCAVSMTAGLWPLANPGQKVIDAMQHPSVNRKPWEFRPLMEHGLIALIRGFEQT